MNLEPTNPHDDKWQALLLRATPTFTGEAEPPYGFVTGTISRLKGARGESDLMERIGLRALFASMAVLVAVGGFTVGVRLQDVQIKPDSHGVVQTDDDSIA